MSSKAQDKDDGIVDSLQRFVTNRPLATFALLGSLAAGGASALAFHYFLEKKRQQRRYLLKKAGYEKFYDSMRKSMNNFGGLFAFELDDQAFRGVLWYVRAFSGKDAKTQEDFTEAVLKCLPAKDCADRGLTQIREEYTVKIRKLEDKQRANGGVLGADDSTTLIKLRGEKNGIELEMAAIEANFIELKAKIASKAPVESFSAEDKIRKAQIEMTTKYCRAAWQRLIHNFDAGARDSELDFEELTRIWAYVNGYLSELDQAEISFQLLDLDGSGFISKKDMMDSLQWRKSLGLIDIDNIAEFVDDTFRMFDKNNDSVMSMIEFYEYFKKTKFLKDTTNTIIAAAIMQWEDASPKQADRTRRLSLWDQTRASFMA